uniref:Uncharacterized protein n=1 Tax=Timema cristinae TaxID=61476 RepID=A0A7R9CE92_TIMCR|nr:unnamed protein product [Timema cristinae]
MDVRKTRPMAPLGGRLNRMSNRERKIVENHIGTKHQYIGRDYNLDFPVIGSLAYFECSTLDHVATKAEITTLSIPGRDLNLDLPVIGSLVYDESSALDHAATGAVASQKYNDNNCLDNLLSVYTWSLVSSHSLLTD